MTPAAPPLLQPAAERSKSPLPGLAVLGAVWLVLMSIALTGASDLIDNDQARPAIYALDALRNGSWIAQTDHIGRVASKPPLHTWLMALSALPTGRLELWNLYLPSALSMLGITGLIYTWARKRFGEGAGLLASMMLLASLYGDKHLTLVRTDALFAFTICATAMAAFYAWTRRGSWIWFWLLCVAVTLTKGPLGVLIAAMGTMGAHFFPGGKLAEEEIPRARVWPVHLIGSLLFLGICLAWVIASYMQLGQAFIDKVIGDELVGHTLHRGDNQGFPGDGFYKPTIYFASRFAPWCVLTVIAIVRVFREPSADVLVRRAERFVAFWFIGSLALISLSPHQRPDLLLPIIPAAAMLAGREASRWVERKPRGSAYRWAAALAALLIAASAGWHYWVLPQNREVLRTTQLRQLAERVETKFGRMPSIVDIDANPLFQVFLNTMSPRVSLKMAVDRMVEAEPPIFAATTDPDALIAALAARGVDAHVIDLALDRGEPWLAIVSARTASDDRLD